MSTVCLCAFIYCSKNKKCAAEATHKKHTARLRHTSFNTQQGYAKMSLRFYLKKRNPMLWKNCSLVWQHYYIISETKNPAHFYFCCVFNCLKSKVFFCLPLEGKVARPKVVTDEV